VEHTSRQENQNKIELQTSGDFLKLTCANEWSLSGSFSFDVTSSHSVIRVTVLDTGIIAFEPDCETTQDIILSSAVHGNETAPIEICNDLIKQLILGEIALKERVLFLFGNPASINIGKRFVEENLNRLFSGEHLKPLADGKVVNNKERIRAKTLEDAVRDFYLQGEKISTQRSRSHYDLHTAIRASKNDKFAVYPFQHGKPRKKEQLLFLKQCGITTILLSHSPTTTFSYFSVNEFGADAFTIELGKVKPFGENNMEDFVAIKTTLLDLISGNSIHLGEYVAEDFEVFEIYQTINREAENFSLNFADNVENFTSFPIDTILVFDGDNEVKVKKEGEAIIFPNADVGIGQRALLTVTPTHIS